MGLQKIRLGTNEDGTPQWLYSNDDPKAHLVITGPITGDVTLKDGTTVNVTDAVIEVKSEKQALAVSDAIGQRYVEEGHPSHGGEGEFVLEQAPPTEKAV